MSFNCNKADLYYTSEKNNNKKPKLSEQQENGNKQPREALDSLSLQVFQKGLDRHLLGMVEE